MCIKTKAALLSVLTLVFLAGCGSQPTLQDKINLLIREAVKPTSPLITKEQMNGIYKIYTVDMDRLFKECNNNECKVAGNAEVNTTYVQILNNTTLKIFATTSAESEISAITKLANQANSSYIIFGDYFYYQSADSTNNSRKQRETLARNYDGDFTNSEFLTVANGKVINRKSNREYQKIQLYDESGNKLLDKPHDRVYFSLDTCKQIVVADGFDYNILPINAPIKESYRDIESNKNTTQDLAILESLSKRPFFLDNVNSSKIKIFPPFGYIMEYGNTFIGKRRVTAYRLYDQDGNPFFGEDDLGGVVKINNHRFLAQTVEPPAEKPQGKELKVFLYDADNKKVLFTTKNVWQNTVSKASEKYDLITVYQDGKSGLIDFDGNIVVDYQDKYSIDRSYKGFIIYSYGQGKSAKKGLLDLKLKPIIDDFDNIDFRDDFFVVFLKNRIVIFDYSKKKLHDLEAVKINFYDKFFVTTFNNKQTYYNYAGNIVLAGYRGLELEAVTKDLFAYTVNGKTALIDINEKEIIPPICDSIKTGGCGTIECRVE